MFDQAVRIFRPAAGVCRSVRALAVTATLLLIATPSLASNDQAAGTGFDFGTLGQAVASLVIFGLLLAILGKYAWGPIVSQLEAREKKIADTIDQAVLRQEEANQLLEQYKARLAAAEGQAQALVADSRKEANTAREKILQQAAQDAQRTSVQARHEIELAKQQAMREIYDQTAILAIDIAGKIIQRNLRPEDQKQIIEESLREIGGEIRSR